MSALFLSVCLFESEKSVRILYACETSRVEAALIRSMCSKSTGLTLFSILLQVLGDRMKSEGSKECDLVCQFDNLS